MPGKFSLLRKVRRVRPPLWPTVERRTALQPFSLELVPCFSCRARSFYALAVGNHESSGPLTPVPSGVTAWTWEEPWHDVPGLILPWIWEEQGWHG